MANQKNGKSEDDVYEPKHIFFGWDLSRAAWQAWNVARLVRPDGTRVGAAVLSESDQIFTGCNIEHHFHCHDIHAEVVAITKMVTFNIRKLEAILVVAARDNFLPCGGCMDWIFEFGGPNCMVGFQSSHDEDIVWRRAAEIMPYYPY